MTWRTEVAALLPWVERLSESTRCDAYRPMSFKARRDPERREQHRCRSLGWWKFTARRDVPHPAPSGTYCWGHLVMHLMGNDKENYRFEAWCREHLDQVNEVRARHGYAGTPWRVYAPPNRRSMDGGL